MFKNDSESEEDEGIISRALAKCTDKSMSDSLDQTKDSVTLNDSIHDCIPIVNSSLVEENSNDGNDSISATFTETDSHCSRKQRKKRGKVGKNNKPSDVICIGSDDEGYSKAFIPQTSNYSSRSGELKGKDELKIKKNSAVFDTISLGSDDDDDELSVDPNEMINVKIEWMCEGGMIMPLRRNQPFSMIYEELSKEKGYDIKYIVLCKNDGKVVKPQDTPLSIKLSIIDVLVGSISSKPNASYGNEDNSDIDAEDNENLFTMRVLVEGKKAPIFVKIEKDQVMLVLLKKMSAKLRCNVDDLKLWFDGEVVGLRETPRTMDFEGDECFEVRFKKK